MPSYTITVTDDQDAGLAYAYAQLQVLVGNTPAPQPPIPATQAEYLQQQVEISVLNPKLQIYVANGSRTLVTSLGTIPDANRAAAKAGLEQVITDNGGTLPSGGVSGGVFSEG